MTRYFPILTACGLILFEVFVQGPAAIQGPLFIFVDICIAIMIFYSYSLIDMRDKNIYAVLACGYRAILLTQPSFSNDTKRYLIDGISWQSGSNPYSHAPRGLNLDHDTISTIYPPLAELIFAFLALFHFRSIYAIAWGLVEFMILTLIYKRISNQKSLCLFYFLCFLPLLVRETYREGHYDSLPVTALIAAFYSRSYLQKILWAGISIYLKFWGVFIVARFFKQRQYARAMFLTLVLLTALAPVVLISPSNAMSGSEAYLKYWSFAQPSLFLLQGFFSYEQSILLAQASFLGVGFLSLAFFLLGGLSFMQFIEFSILALMLTPVQHPWYFLIALVPALLSPRSANWRLALLFWGHNYGFYENPNHALFSLLPLLAFASVLFKIPLRIKFASNRDHQ